MIGLIMNMDGTYYERGEVDLPRLERLLDADQKGFALSLRREMKSITYHLLGPFSQTGDSGRSQWSSVLRTTR